MYDEVLKITAKNPQLEMEVLEILGETKLAPRLVAGCDLFACFDSQGHVEGIACTKVFGEDCLLLLVAVREAVRRKGVGSALVNHVLGYFSGHCERMYALAVGVEGFFDRFGFSRVGRRDLPDAFLEAEEIRALIDQAMVTMVLPLPRKTLIN